MIYFFPEDSSIASLIKTQKIISEKAIIRDDFEKIELIAAADKAFLKDRIISGIIVMEYPALLPVERAFSIQPICFPYIPTFLGFREGPAIVKAFENLKIRPDLLLIDGAGINHPRSAGLATHIGVAMDIPTIGITKRILCGKGEYPEEVGAASPLVHADRTVGWLLQLTKKAVP